MIRELALCALVVAGLGASCSPTENPAGASGVQQDQDGGKRAAGGGAGTADADPNYPAKPVRLLEPFGAGGGPDVIARAVAGQLSEIWKQPVTVENHPGAGSTAAPALVAKAPPDGYTLLVNTSAQAYSAAFLKELPYDPLADFIPIAPLTSQAYVLVAGKPAGVTTVAELVAAAKARPGQLKFASTGIGTGTHVGLETFNLAAGIRAEHVPAGSSDAIADVVAGTVAGRTAYLMAPVPLVLQAIRDGDLVALGVSTARRSPLLPDAPTLAEAGVEGYDHPIWYGVWAPARTPAGIVDALARDIARALADPQLRDRLAKDGAEPMSMTRSEFVRFVASERERAAGVMASAAVEPR